MSDTKYISLDNLSTFKTNYDSIVNNIREVAEGKTQAYPIDDTKTGTVSGRTICNSDFNSNNDTITITDSMSASNPKGLQLINDISGANAVGLNSLKLGDVVYITQLDVPDRWFGGRTVSGGNYIYTFYKMETTKVDLTQFYTKIQTNALLNEKANTSDVYTKSQADKLPAYKSFDNSWVVNSTTSAFCSSLVSDSNVTEGMAFVGMLNCNDLPNSMAQAECIVEIIKEDVSNGKHIHLILLSADTQPYHWEYNYVKINGNYTGSGWKGYVTEDELDDTLINNLKLADLSTKSYITSYTLNEVADIVWGNHTLSNLKGKVAIRNVKGHVINGSFDINFTNDLCIVDCDYAYSNNYVLRLMVIHYGEIYVISWFGSGNETSTSVQTGVQGNVTIPSGTTATDLSNLKIGSSYYKIPNELPSLTDNAGKVLKVNSNADGVEWADESGGSGSGEGGLYEHIISFHYNDGVDIDADIELQIVNKDASSYGNNLADILTAMGTSWYAEPFLAFRINIKYNTPFLVDVLSFTVTNDVSDNPVSLDLVLAMPNATPIVSAFNLMFANITTTPTDTVTPFVIGGGSTGSGTQLYQHIVTMGYNDSIPEFHEIVLKLISTNGTQLTLTNSLQYAEYVMNWYVLENGLVAPMSFAYDADNGNIHLTATAFSSGQYIQFPIIIYNGQAQEWQAGTNGYTIISMVDTVTTL